jgi:hypothetical protein
VGAHRFGEGGGDVGVDEVGEDGELGLDEATGLRAIEVGGAVGFAARMARRSSPTASGAGSVSRSAL